MLTSSGITVSTSSNKDVLSAVERGLNMAAKSVVPCWRINAANCNKNYELTRYFRTFNGIFHIVCGKEKSAKTVFVEKRIKVKENKIILTQIQFWRFSSFSFPMTI